MKANLLRLRQIARWSSLFLMLAMGLSACAGSLGFGGTSWREEALLHDGKKIVVKRSQNYGGRHEIGQSAPVKEHTITFSLPDSGRAISWTSEYGEELGRTNFNLLALHVFKDTPYLVAEPNLCLSYNKWGRPNPPYVFFKYDGKEWRRIGISELPAEFKTINLIVNNGREEDIKALERKSGLVSGFVSAEDVREINSSLRQPEYRSILRETLPNAAGSCGEMIYDGKGGWIGVGWFRKQPSYDACVTYCEWQKMEAQYCPCATLFKGK